MFAMVFMRSAASDGHLADPDDFRGDVPNAMHADQLAIFFLENQLQSSAPSGDGAARRAGKVRPSDFVVKALVRGIALP